MTRNEAIEREIIQVLTADESWDRTTHGLIRKETKWITYEVARKNESLRTVDSTEVSKVLQSMKRHRQVVFGGRSGWHKGWALVSEQVAVAEAKAARAAAQVKSDEELRELFDRALQAIADDPTRKLQLQRELILLSLRGV